MVIWCKIQVIINPFDRNLTERMHQLSLHNTLFQNFGVKNFESIFTGGFIMDPPKQDIRKNLLRRILKNVVRRRRGGGG